MQLHQLKPLYKRRRPRRVGRGGKRGTYSGHGIKGQRARAGRKFAPVIRELIKRYPKLRGYRFKPNPQSLKLKTAVVNLDVLEKKFASGEKITPKLLLQNKIIRRIKGRVPRVKILGKGKVSKKLAIEGCDMSKSAKAAIEGAGGKVS